MRGKTVLSEWIKSCRKKTDDQLKVKDTQIIHLKFDPYSYPYHGKIGQHTLTLIKISFLRKSHVCNT